MLLLILVTILRLPTFFTPHYYGDEEIYFVMGRAWRDGVPLYQEMFDHKPPLIYVLAGVAQNVFWFRAFLYISMALHTIVFWKIARLFFGQTAKATYASSLLFVGLTSLPLLEGNIANAELFMMLPVSVSLLLLWREPVHTRAYLRVFLAGVIAGLGWLFKIPVVMDVAAMALYLFVFRPKTFVESLKGLFSRPLIIYAFGFVLPLASTFVYYYLKGSGSSYLDTVLTMNLGYVSSWSTSSFSFNPLKSGLVVRGGILLTFTVLLYLLRKRLDKRLVLASLWFAFSFFGALLSGRPYPHYLQEPSIPFALLVPLVFRVQGLASWAVIAYLSLWGVITNKQIKFWGYPSWPLYDNFAKYMVGKMDKKTYFETFDGVERNYQLAKFLNERMGAEDQLFVWSSDAAVYNLTDKLPSGGKYIVNFHIHDLKKYDYVMANLELSKPKYIVVYPEYTDFSAFEQLLQDKYLEVAEFGEIKVYMRLQQGL